MPRVMRMLPGLLICGVGVLASAAACYGQDLFGAAVPLPGRGPRQALPVPIRTEPWYPYSAYMPQPRWAYTGPLALAPSWPILLAEPRDQVAYRPGGRWGVIRYSPREWYPTPRIWHGPVGHWPAVSTRGTFIEVRSTHGPHSAPLHHNELNQLDHKPRMNHPPPAPPNLHNGHAPHSPAVHGPTPQAVGRAPLHANQLQHTSKPPADWRAYLNPAVQKGGSATLPLLRVAGDANAAGASLAGRGMQPAARLVARGQNVTAQAVEQLQADSGPELPPVPKPVAEEQPEDRQLVPVQPVLLPLPSAYRSRELPFDPWGPSPYQQESERIAPKGTLEREIGQLDAWLEQQAGTELEPRICREIAQRLFTIYRYPEAKQYYERALEADRRLYGDNHPYVAHDLNRIGAVLQAQGLYEQAIEYFQKAYEIYESVLGPEHARTARTLNYIGTTEYLKGNYRRARAYLRRALRVSERHALNHHNIARDANNLGNVLLRLGDLHEARVQFGRALNLYEALYGPDHPYVAVVLNNMGRLLEAQGDNEGARTHYLRAQEILESAYGPDGAAMAVTEANLGLLARAEGDYAEAEAHLQHAATELQNIKTALGTNHPHIATVETQLGRIALDRGDAARAEQFLQQAHAKYTARLGAEHPDAAIAMYNEALVKLSTGQAAEAERLLRRAIELLEQRLGPNHPDVAAALNALGKARFLQGDYNEAMSFCRRAAAIYEKQFGSSHLNVASSLNNLAAIYHRMGDLDAAEAFYKRSLAIYEATLQPNHPDVAGACNNLGLLLMAVARQSSDPLEREYRLIQARTLLERALAIHQVAYGPNHTYTAATLRNLAEVLEEMGDEQGAKVYYKQALDVLSKRLGPEPPRVIEPPKIIERPKPAPKNPPPKQKPAAKPATQG